MRRTTLSFALTLAISMPAIGAQAAEMPSLVDGSAFIEEIDPRIEKDLRRALKEKAGGLFKRYRARKKTELKHDTIRFFHPDGRVVLSSYQEDDTGMSDRDLVLYYDANEVGLDAELASLLADTPGGNFFFTSTLPEIEQVFDDNFVSVAFPLAYDMEIALDLEPGWSLARVYGLPGDPEGKGAATEVKTVFLSERGGGILARLTHDDTEGGTDNASLAATTKLGYVPEPAFGYEGEVHQLAEVQAPQDAADDAPVGLRKGSALVNMGVTMRRAVEAYFAGEPGSARVVLDELLTLLRAEADALDDDALRREVDLVEQLKVNMGG